MGRDVLVISFFISSISIWSAFSCVPRISALVCRTVLFTPQRCECCSLVDVQCTGRRSRCAPHMLIETSSSSSRFVSLYSIFNVVDCGWTIWSPLSFTVNRFPMCVCVCVKSIVNQSSNPISKISYECQCVREYVRCVRVCAHLKRRRERGARTRCTQTRSK